MLFSRPRTVVLAALAVSIGAATAALAGTTVRMDIDGLVRRADLVFEGRILSSRAFVGENGLIQTEYVARQSRSFLGASLETQVFRLPGGVLESGRGAVIPGMPALELDEAVVLFLGPESSQGLRMPVGLAQGKFRVVTSATGERSLLRTQTDLMLVDPVTGVRQAAHPRDEQGYDHVVAAIQAAVARKHAAEELGEEAR